MSPFYITTAIAYVNGVPHVGHALEFAQADALARYHRLIGDDVFFLTGTDEHGIKIFEKAAEKGMNVMDFVDQNSKVYEKFTRLFDMSNDGFVRTTSEKHKKVARDLWKKMFDNGDVYKGSYSGNYCVGCEAYLNEKDVDDEGKCLVHKKMPVAVEEENYFFKLSKYSDKIREAIESDRVKIEPENRKKELLNMIGDGLFDVSFSRPKSSLIHGVNVPNDDEHVMYVWCDALANYLTGIGYGDNDALFEKFWPCNAHIVGKDILRFHATIWLGMLMSVGLELPEKIYVHGFVTSDGEKMSKSLGNVIDPIEYVEKYGSDAVRWYLLREIPTLNDGDFGKDHFVEVYNAELANRLGNLVNRVVMMTHKYFDGVVPDGRDEFSIEKVVLKLVNEYQINFENYNIKKASESLIDMMDFGNKYIDDMKPWSMVKAGDDVSFVMYNLAELIRIIGVLITPIMPSAAERLFKILNLSISENISDIRWGSVKFGILNEPQILFPRIDE